MLGQKNIFVCYYKSHLSILVRRAIKRKEKLLTKHKSEWDTINRVYQKEIK